MKENSLLTPDLLCSTLPISFSLNIGFQFLKSTVKSSTSFKALSKPTTIHKILSWKSLTR